MSEKRPAVGQDHREFFAAVAGDGVHRAHAARQAACYGLRHLIAGQMAVGVVDALEVVDVQQQQQDRVAGTRDRFDRASSGNAGDCPTA